MDDWSASAIRTGATLWIGRARLHNAAPGDRDRLALGLEAVRPAAIGVPDRALLIVPRLVVRKPLPRHGDAGLFAGDVADAVRVALRRARRPGEPASSSDSFFFADELDAAVRIIEQWLAGAPPAERAWWPHVTGGVAPPVWWRRAIRPDGRRLPSVIARLARRGVAQPWLERLDPGDIRTGLGAIAEAYGLTLPPIAEAPAPARQRRSSDAVSADLAPAAALVEAIAPEARRADLPPPVRLLLLVGLIAERRPAMLAVRTARLAFAAVAAGTLPEPGERAHPPRPRARSSSASVPDRPLQRARTRRTEPGPSPASLTPTLPAPLEETATRRPQDLKPPESAVRAPVERPARPAPEAWDEAPCPSAEIGSEYGGLLFLLSALLALGIYGDFSEPRRSLPGLSPFGLLRLLGRAWFGAPFVADPLHGLLVRLAGGRRADPARDFEARPWSVPRIWLLPWPDSGPALVAPRGRRPMLWHPAGFPLAELDGGDPPSAARAARQLGLKGRPGPSRLPALPVAPRARWIACLRLYLEARVGKGLGCAGGIEAVTLLCRRPARIRVDGDRIEARFALDDHPLAIRLAGLDRDPGWIPAARYDFRHYFE